jgi:hypothetical protein
VVQCFFIRDPTRESRVVIRRGKRRIIRMDGAAHEEEFEQYDDPKIENENDDK